MLRRLDGCKPNLIVNSADQDCHFADPITSMRLAAHGYAELSALIIGSAAVLEVGYAAFGPSPGQTWPSS